MLFTGFNIKKSNVYYLQIIEREFDNLCQNFSIRPNTPTNLKSKSCSNTPLFSNSSLYEFSEFCNIYKDNHLCLEPNDSKLENNGESTAVKLIEKE